MRVGMIVHYVSYGISGGEYHSHCRAAIITEVTSYGGTDGITPPRATLCVLNPKGTFYDENLAYVPLGEHEPLRGGTWHRLEECDT